MPYSNFNYFTSIYTILAVYSFPPQGCEIQFYLGHITLLGLQNPLLSEKQLHCYRKFSWGYYFHLTKGCITLVGLHNLNRVQVSIKKGHTTLVGLCNPNKVVFCNPSGINLHRNYYSKMLVLKYLTQTILYYNII